MLSAIDLTKRALVILLKSLVASYGVVLNIQRDSPDKRRLRNLLRSKHAQTVARKKFQNLKKVCKIVSKAKGAHSGQ